MSGAFPRGPIIWNPERNDRLTSAKPPDLTSEQFGWFIRNYLIQPDGEGGYNNPVVYKNGKRERVVVPRSGYMQTSTNFVDLTHERFLQSIFSKGKPPYFLGMGNAIDLNPSFGSSADPLMISENEKVKFQNQTGGFQGYLDKMSPDGIMYFQKAVNGVVPGKTGAGSYGAVPLFWPPTKKGQLGNDFSPEEVESKILDQFQVHKRFDCMVVFAGKTYLEAIAGAENTTMSLETLRNSPAVQAFLSGLPTHLNTVEGLLRPREVEGQTRRGRYVAICVFSPENYMKYRAALLKKTREFKKEFDDPGKVLNVHNGGWKDIKKQKALRKKVFDKNNYEYMPLRKKEPDYRGLLKLRLENSQALLISAMPKINQLNGILPTLKDKVTNPRATASSDEVKQLVPECLKTYVSEPQSMVDLIANPFGIEEFLCARPAEIAYLQPRLQFYLNDVPVEFPDYTDGDRLVKVAKTRISNAEALQKIFNSTGVKGSDVGVKSFSWNFNNKHHGDSTLRASLVLYFANTTELLNQQYLKFVFGGRTDTQAHRARARKANKSAGLGAAELKKELDTRIKVMGEPNSFYGADSPHTGDVIESKALGTRKDNPPPQLKVQVGWSVPNDKDKSLSPQFKEGIVRTQRLLNLHLWQYNVNFGETGDVTLTLDYIGGIDEFLSTPDKSNIFDTALDMTKLHTRKTFVSTGSRMRTVEGSFSIFDMFGGFSGTKQELSPISGQVQLSKLVWPEGYLAQQLKDGNNINVASDGVQRVGVSKGGLLYELESLRLWKRSLISQGGKKPSPAISEKIKVVSDYMKPVRQALVEVDRSHSDLVYSSFMTRLISSGKLYYATARRNIVDGTGGFREIKNASRTTFGNKINLGTTFAANANLGRKKGWHIDVRGGRPASAGGVGGVSERFQKLVNHNSGLRQAGNFSRTALNYLDPTQQDPTCLEPGVDDDYSILYYMKLGDILDIILCGLKKKPTAPEAEFILGSFYPHMLGIPNTSPGDLYSLRDIPISIDYFGNWFINSFLSKGTKPKASFKRFADSLLTDMVAPLFNRILRNTSANNLGRMEFGFSAMASPVKLGPSPLVTADSLRNVARDKRRGNNASLNQSQYYLMYMKQLNPKLQGNRAEDHARGIYHLVLGSDRGIVKSFAFSQVDLPYYKEMLIEQGNFAEGLFIPQNVNITMIGNTFFRNGQTIYVNADFGLGVAAQKLGIGGYYTVTRVDNAIDKGRFETRIQCQFVKRLGG